MAVGVFFGFLLPPGLQLLVVIPVALLLKANIITAVAGTFMTNPVTYVPVYYFTCKVGELFLHHLCGADVHLNTETLKDLLVSMIHLNIAGLGENVLNIVLSWVAGGIIVGLAAAVLAYYGSYAAIIEIRKLGDFSRARRAARHQALAGRTRQPPEQEPAETDPSASQPK